MFWKLSCLQKTYKRNQGTPTYTLSNSSIFNQLLIFFLQSLHLTPCDPKNYNTPGFPSFTISQSFLKFISTGSVMLSNHLILCHPLLLLPSIFPSIRVFSNESVLCSRWPKYWSFSFSICLSSEYSGLISFRINWFDLLLVQHHNLKASILWCTPSLWSNTHICTWLLEKP